MCGIVGFLSQSPVLSFLLDGLERLEYRGYDSAGLALLDNQGKKIYKALGSLSHLRAEVSPQMEILENAGYRLGIGHTRWATHGPATLENTHPQTSHHVLLVHNGIIENFSPLKKELVSKGYTFSSDTDTEVAAHLLDHALALNSQDLQKAFSRALDRLEGNFALAWLVTGFQDRLFVARRGTAPMVVGIGQEKVAVSSDPLGFLGQAEKIAYVPHDTWCEVTLHQTKAFTFKGEETTLSWQKNPALDFSSDKGTFPHFMWKEMHEQPHILQALSGQSLTSLSHLLGKDPAHVTLLGCGTSYYAGSLGKYMMEKRYPVTLELASEFHYRQPVMSEGVTIALSQSGETVDTIKAAEYAKKQGQILVAVVNVPHSTLARMADFVLETQAGPEISVASTKSFLAQTWILMTLAGLHAQENIKSLLQETLDLQPTVVPLAKSLIQASHLMYLGRGINAPLAAEGALKMNELAYIPSQAMASGELKHGPIALVDQKMPMIFIAPHDPLFFKTLSNIHEVAARKGNIFILTDPEGWDIIRQDEALSSLWQEESSLLCKKMILPQAPERLKPFVFTVGLQMLAYTAAVLLNRPIDKPRNLAKSVTVE